MGGVDSWLQVTLAANGAVQHQHPAPAPGSGATAGRPDSVGQERNKSRRGSPQPQTFEFIRQAAEITKKRDESKQVH